MWSTHSNWYVSISRSLALSPKLRIFFFRDANWLRHWRTKTKKRFTQTHYTHTRTQSGFLTKKKWNRFPIASIKRCWLLEEKTKEFGEGRRGEIWIRFVSLFFDPYFCYLFVCFFPSLTWPLLYRSMGSKEKPRRVWLAIIIISLSIKPDTIIITLSIFSPALFQFIIHSDFFSFSAHLIRIILNQWL